MSRITLLIHCPDTSGIIAAVTSFFFKNKGNIIYIDQYVDVENNIFFMRLESEFNRQIDITDLKKKFSQHLGKPFNMTWDIYPDRQKLRMAIFVSKYDHCLYDILSRYRSGELNVIIPAIISNRKDLRPLSESFNIPF